MNKILDSLKKMNKLPMRVFGIFVGIHLSARSEHVRSTRQGGCQGPENLKT
jgi:hypothetical protein